MLCHGRDYDEYYTIEVKLVSNLCALLFDTAPSPLMPPKICEYSNNNAEHKTACL